MPKATFSKDEVKAAQQANAALLLFRLEGWHLPGFPFKGYEDGGLIPPDLATEAVEWFAAFMGRVRAATSPSAADPSRAASPRP
jgi:hypothetical protein